MNRVVNFIETIIFVYIGERPVMIHAYPFTVEKFNIVFSIFFFFSNFSYTCLNRIWIIYNAVRV